MDIHRLTAEEASVIYKKHLVRDFPPDEVKPFRAIRSLMKAGSYECFSMTEEQCILGYAFFVKLGDHYLLDYLAVTEGNRNQGLGAQFLDLLSRQLRGAESVIAEVESPAHAPSPEEQLQRQRRLDFYLRNGFIDTQVTAHTFGVDYRLVARTRNPSVSVEEIRSLYASHYRAMLPGFVFRRMIKL